MELRGGFCCRLYWPGVKLIYLQNHGSVMRTVKEKTLMPVIDEIEMKYGL